METYVETHGQTSCGERVKILGLYQICSFRVQGILEKGKQKDCNSQRRWRKTGKQGPLNQLSKAYMKSQRLKPQA